jgi:hypothetical protein
MPARDRRHEKETTPGSEQHRGTTRQPDGMAARGSATI